jgi:hypothetical protein
MALVDKKKVLEVQKLRANISKIPLVHETITNNNK